MTNDFNLACIMVMPPYQRRGFGKFLIALSYHLSQGRKCTPEKPLSDMGKVGYKSYWSDTILEALTTIKKSAVAGIYHPSNGLPPVDWSALTVRELSDLTLLQEDDIEQTLSGMGLLKYLKGQKLVNTQLAAKAIEEYRVKKGVPKVGQVSFRPEKVLVERTSS